MTSEERLESVPLREYVEALFERERAARDLADAEREKAAQALAIEREKTAQALAVSLAQQITSGDAALSAHIAQQIAQIREALTSANLLETERIRSVEASIEGLAHETRLTHAASEAAVAKAEALNKERWESANEWRGQSADRERTQEEQMSKLANTFMRQDTADAKFESLRRQVQEITEKVGRLA
jgi:hypothetical protein